MKITKKQLKEMVKRETKRQMKEQAYKSRSKADIIGRAMGQATDLVMPIEQNIEELNGEVYMENGKLVFIDGSGEEIPAPTKALETAIKKTEQLLKVLQRIRKHIGG